MHRAKGDRFVRANELPVRQWKGTGSVKGPGYTHGFVFVWRHLIAVIAIDFGQRQSKSDNF